jgi:hypothetical protein
MPDVRSLPPNVNPTARLYQPSTSAARAGWPPVTIGGVWSTLIFSCTVTVADPSSALQNSLVPGVSAVNVLSWQPVTTDASVGRTVQSTDTSERYQPEQSCGAGVHLNVTLGTACAAGAASSVRRQTSAHAAAA